MLSKLETQLGQLAVARGLIELTTLMRCVAQSSSQGMVLTDLLRDEGYLDEAQLTELHRDLNTGDERTLREEFDQGDTLVHDAVYNTARSHELAGEMSTGFDATLAESPPPLDTPNRKRATADTPGTSEIASCDLSLSDEKRYEFTNELGRGGMGQVLLARDLLLQRDIALKTLLPDTSDANARRRLLQEAQITGLLEHSSIIPIYDLGALSSDDPYYTMRVVRERSLAQIIEEMSAGQGHDYSLTQLVSILRQVCLAVHYAHDRGIIHRDLKPENILVGSYGEVFVIDWGVAKVVDSELHALALSQRHTEREGALVGTPYYMSPEQAQGRIDALDQRTDVYALGAILYEVLTLVPVFESSHMLSLLFKVIEQAPQAPTERTPQRSIPRELEEICLKALAKSADERFQSAQEMAEDLELFLEGVKERERRQEMADEALRQADEVRGEYEQVQRRYTEAVQQVNHDRLNVPSWVPHEEKEQIWELEQHVEDLQVEVERHFGEATRLYGQALGHVPEMSEARRALADLYWERFREAEAGGDRARAAYFEGLVRQFNDGWYDQLLEGSARLTVLTSPEPASATLYRFVEVNRRLVERREADLGQTPIRNLEIQHGSYVVELHRDGHVMLKVPVHLDRLEEKTLDLRLYRRDQLADDFVVIAGGTFLSGEIQPQNLDEHTRYVPDFAIMKNPVTCGDYLQFLNALAADDLQRALRHAPRLEEGESYFPVSAQGTFSLPSQDAEGGAWDLDWPICMLSYQDATAYAHWRSQRDGRPYRLPTAEEWEKAARGVDGRIYPWGNHFDPSFCRMRDSERGKPMPVPVGAYKMDRSPYDVRHLAGNVIEWTTTLAAKGDDRRIIQGGSFNSIELMCRLDWHMDLQEAQRMPFCGFRLATSL
ncbi:MAG: protein kinase domain-containing protein [Persicimonas sp.]